MGMQSIRAGALSKLVVPLLAVAALLGACDNNDSRRSVSPGAFLAPIPAMPPGGDGGIRTLLDKVDILGPIDPSLLRSEVAQRQANPLVMGTLNERSLLMYEGQSRAVLTVSLCGDPNDCLPVNDNDNSKNVTLHYTSAGLSEAQRAPQASISEIVPPIRVRINNKNWILAYDANTRSILGFRYQESVITTDDQGNLVSVGYRVAPRLLGRVDTENENFGQGNGLLLTEVITGEALKDALGVNVITRMFAIEENRILLFFGQALPAIHLLEVTVAEERLDYDLETEPDFVDPKFDQILTEVLKGKITFVRDNPLDPNSPKNRPFLTFRTISEVVTETAVVRVDEYQPVIIPQNPPGALLYDSQSFNFMKVVVAKDVQGEVIGGVPVTVISAAVFLENLRQTAGITNSDGPFTMGDTLFPPGGLTEIWIMEEVTNNLLCYDYSIENPNDLAVISVCVPSRRFSGAFDPQGRDTAVGGAELELVFATADVRGNRLAFDRGSDRIYSISYSSRNVAVVARRADLIFATGDALAEILLTKPLNENNVRLFDAQSVAVVELPIDYALYPISF